MNKPTPLSEQLVIAAGQHAAHAQAHAETAEAYRLDAFSREHREGWDAFGDDVNHFTPALPQQQHAA